MPPLLPLATRYLAWLVGLTFLYGLLVQVAGLPNSIATGVILASVPAADVGLQAQRRATRNLLLADWARIWGLCFALFVAIRLLLPLAMFPPVRAQLLRPEALGSTGLVLFSTAVMMVLFLWIGRRSAGGDG